MGKTTPKNHPTSYPPRRQLGAYYETLAVHYLQRNHFTLLQRNYRYQKAEIDLIARRNDCLHFIEVKARSNIAFGYPESFVSVGQQNRIKLAAEHFLLVEGWQQAIQFDILALTIFEGKVEFFHFEDVFI